MKQVIQLNDEGYVIGTTYADESPLEPGVYHIPRNCIDAPLPNVPENCLVKWNGTDFVVEPILEEIIPEPEPLTYKQKRALAYPSLSDQLDIIYWDQIKGTSVWLNMITEVKNSIPKE